MKKITIVFISTLSILLGSSVYIWWISLGKYQKAEHWLKNVHEIKTYRAKTIESPKLIISSGSNSLFGINSKILSKETGLPVVNVAGHAGMTFNFHAYQAARNAQAGDVIIMPLEYSYYLKTNTLSDQQVQNMESWGHEYLKSLSVKEKLNYLRHSKLSGIIGRIATDTPLPVEDTRIALNSNNQLADKDIISWVGYSYKSMNFYGDIIPDSPPTASVTSSAENGGKYLLNPVPSRQFIEDARALSETLERKGATLYFTWPASMKNKLYDMDSEPNFNLAMTLKNNMLDQGFNFICSPADFNFTPDNFFDSLYHLNFKGAILRTLNLASCLNEAGLGKGKVRAGDNTRVAEETYTQLKHKHLTRIDNPPGNMTVQK